jgi:hypothetical protein
MGNHQHNNLKRKACQSTGILENYSSLEGIVTPEVWAYCGFDIID